MQRFYTDTGGNFMLSQRLLAQKDENLRYPMAQHAWAYSAIHATATALSQVQARVMRYRSMSQQDSGQPVPDDDPFQRALRKPNSAMTGSQFAYAISASLDLYGEALIWMASDASGAYKPGAPPIVMRIVPFPRSWQPEIEQGVLVGWKDHEGKPVPADQVLQIKLWNPANPFRGLAPTDPLSLTLRTDHKAEQFSEAFFDNGADPGGVLVSDLPIDSEQRQAMRREWDDRHAGASKARRTAILQNGMRYEQIPVNFQHMQWLEGRQWNRDEILGVYGVPKQEVALIEDVNRAAAETSAKLWWTSRLIPRLRLIAEAFSEFWFEGDDLLMVEHDLSAVVALQENLDEAIGQAERLVKMGWSANEANERVGLGMPRATELDVRLVPTNMVPLEQLIAAGEESEEDGEGDPEDPEGDEEEADEPEEESEEERSYRWPVQKRMHTDGRRAVVEAWERSVHHPGEAGMRAGMRSYYRRVAKAQAEVFAVWADRVGLEEREIEADGVKRKFVPLAPTQVDDFLLRLHAMQAVMEEESSVRVANVAERALRGLEADLGGFTVVQPNLDTPWVRHIVRRRMAKMIQLPSGDREQIRKLLLNTIETDGFGSIREIQAKMRAGFNHLSNTRGLTIARTETGILANSVRFTGLEQEGIERHEWVTAGDDLVRPEEGESVEPGKGNHRALDGEVVEIGKPFSNGLRYPQDPDANDPAEIINCRCVAVPAE